MKFLPLQKPIHVLQLPPACSAMSPNFHLPPRYEHQSLAVNISLDVADLNMVNILLFNFPIRQHLEKHWNETQLHHLASLPSIPVNQLYKHIINDIQPIAPFKSPEESTGESVSIWTLFSHKGVYEMAVRLLIPAGLGIFCCYFFWC